MRRDQRARIEAIIAMREIVRNSVSINDYAERILYNPDAKYHYAMFPLFGHGGAFGHYLEFLKKANLQMNGKESEIHDPLIWAVSTRNYLTEKHPEKIRRIEDYIGVDSSVMDDAFLSKDGLLGVDGIDLELATFFVDVHKIDILENKSKIYFNECRV